MKTPEEIAQWVIDNRYPKSENDKVSDFEMYQTLVDDIKNIVNHIEVPPLEKIDDNGHRILHT